MYRFNFEAQLKQTAEEHLMPITVNCDCGHQFRARDEHAGRKAQCPACGDLVVIPTASSHSAPAGESPEEFPTFTSFASSGAQSSTRRRGRRLFGGLDSGFFGMGRLSGLACLLIGLISVLFARGCDSLENSWAARYAADYELKRNEFAATWEEKKYQVKADIQVLQDKIDDTRDRMSDANANVRANLQDQIDDYNEIMREEREELDDLEKEEREERREKEARDWKLIRTKANNARANNRMGRVWRQMLFVFGTIILSVGLLTVGFTGEPHERRICLIMITIITFSIYVGGVAWLDSVVSSIR